MITEVMMKTRMIRIYFLFLLLQGMVHAREDFVPLYGYWKYSNGVTPPPENWIETGFDDSKWLVGQSPLGYGKHHYRTKIRTEKPPRPIAAYFRYSFHVDDPSKWAFLNLEYKADDGAVVFLNGKQISKFNMPNGEITSETKASRTLRDWIWSKFETFEGSLLVKGKNTVAVRTHQGGPNSSDLLLRFAMTGIERGIQSKVLMEKDATWKYSDQRQLPDDDWMQPEYDHADWKSGNGVFGYGNPEVTTKLDFGDDENDKNNCAWFRKEFTLEDNMDVRAILLKMRFDDAIVVYLNGREVGRKNITRGYLDEQTVSGEEVKNWSTKKAQSVDIPISSKLPKKNVLAVQLHGSGPRNKDLCFSLSSCIIEYFEKDSKAPPAIDITPEVVAKKQIIKLNDASSVKRAQAIDWAYSSQKYQNIAVSSYESGKLQVAQRAHCAAKLAELFAGEASSLNPRIKSTLMSADRIEIAQEFLDLHSEFDNHDRVYEILNEILVKDEKSFQTYLNLALAIALVYDEQPPRGWPHHQVDSSILPRKLPDPVDAFEFWVQSDTGGKTLHPLAKLGIGELKYVVDSPAGLDDLRKAQKLRVRLTNLAELYPGIEYDQDRLQQRLYNWPHASYRLEDILEKGGICVDQAYYTVQVAKAFGVPSMLVSGAGSHGNHAWVGYLNQRERWDFQTGRYEESKYVTGLTYDPQTWQQPTDHELSLLTERFQISPRYRISRIHSLFASFYLEKGDWPKAVKAARSAIKNEGRNFEAWNLLAQAEKKNKTSQEVLRKIYEDGARSFSRIADLEAHFLKRLSTSLQQEGQVEEAEKVRQKIIARNRRERPDLALEEAKAGLDQLIQEGSIEEQISYYKKEVVRLRDAGLVTYYGLTQPFLEHLQDEDQNQMAKELLDYTEGKLEVKEGSQLAEEFANWSRLLAE